jgi:hypothetical protein
LSFPSVLRAFELCTEPITRSLSSRERFEKTREREDQTKSD